MGHEMAFNLFGKALQDSHGSQFVVCDAVPDTARSFYKNFLSKFPGANIRIVGTPEEYEALRVLTSMAF
jgi:3-hydroxyisobutyrate dehydrogenase